MDSSFDSKLPATETTVLDLTKSNELAQSEALRKNALAVSYVSLAMNSPKLLPKVEAAIQFLQHGGKHAIITSINLIEAAINGKAGTEIISNDPEKER